MLAQTEDKTRSLNKRSLVKAGRTCSEKEPCQDASRRLLVDLFCWFCFASVICTPDWPWTCYVLRITLNSWSSHFNLWSAEIIYTTTCCAGEQIQGFVRVRQALSQLICTLRHSWCTLGRSVPPSLTRKISLMLWTKGNVLNLRAFPHSHQSVDQNNKYLTVRNDKGSKGVTARELSTLIYGGLNWLQKLFLPWWMQCLCNCGRNPCHSSCLHIHMSKGNFLSWHMLAELVR